MRAWLMDGYNGVESLRLGDVPDPQPGPAQVLLKMKFAALNPADALVRALENTLRRRPLSGVLCEIDAEPLTLDFGNHEGLMLLYAERLADHPKREWTPEGRGREYLELVLDRRGVKNSPLLMGVA